MTALENSTAESNRDSIEDTKCSGSRFPSISHNYSTSQEYKMGGKKVLRYVDVRHPSTNTQALALTAFTNRFSNRLESTSVIQYSAESIMASRRTAMT